MAVSPKNNCSRTSAKGHFLRLFCRMRNRSYVSEREFTRLVDRSILPWVVNFCLYFRWPMHNLACERRPISGCRLSPPKNTVCELEPRNDFRDVKLLFCYWPIKFIDRIREVVFPPPWFNRYRIFLFTLKNLIHSVCNAHFYYCFHPDNPGISCHI